MGGGVVLLLQNSQSLGLVVFNQAVPLQLPLSVWVILAVLIGIVTSVLVQLLLRVEVQGGDRLNQRFESIKQRPTREPDRRTGRSDWERSRATYDWTDKELEQKDEETWDIETPPERPTRPRPPQDSQPSPPRRSRSNPPNAEEIRPQPQPERPRPEPIAEPEPVRPPKPIAQPPENGVVDANYRVITPPYNPDDGEPRVNIEDDEEWI